MTWGTSLGFPVMTTDLTLVVHLSEAMETTVRSRPESFNDSSWHERGCPVHAHHKLWFVR